MLSAHELPQFIVAAGMPDTVTTAFADKHGDLVFTSIDRLHHDHHQKLTSYLRPNTVPVVVPGCQSTTNHPLPMTSYQILEPLSSHSEYIPQGPIPRRMMARKWTYHLVHTTNNREMNELVFEKMRGVSSNPSHSPSLDFDRLRDKILYDHDK